MPERYYNLTCDHCGEFMCTNAEVYVNRRCQVQKRCEGTMREGVQAPDPGTCESCDGPREPRTFHPSRSRMWLCPSCACSCDTTSPLNDPNCPIHSATDPSVLPSPEKGDGGLQVTDEAVELVARWLHAKDGDGYPFDESPNREHAYELPARELLTAALPHLSDAPSAAPTEEDE